MKTNLTGFALLGAFALAGCGDKDADSTVVEVNNIPTANAGDDITQGADESVVLDGAGSFDADGDTLTYVWSFEYVPEGSALLEQGQDAFFPNNSTDAVSSSFSPDVVGTYVAALKVHDTAAWSVADYVVIVTETPETIPVADAGTDIVANKGDTVCTDGSGSYDPTGKDLTYLWSVVDIPELSTLDNSGLTDADASAMCFTADARGVYTFGLQVSNGLATSLSDAVNVTSVGDNGEPVANAGNDKVGQDCTWHGLDATSSVDPDGDSLKYFWELQSKPSDSETSSDDSFNPDRYNSNPTFFADTAGVYVLSLTVFDGENWSSPDIISITAGERSFNSPPVVSIATPDTVDAGAACCEPSGYVYNCEECTSQTVNLGDLVTITDPDNDPVTIVWESIEGSAVFVDVTDPGTNIAIDDLEPTEPLVTDDIEIQLSMTATDCTGAVTVATVTQIVQCRGADETDTGIDCVSEE